MLNFIELLKEIPAIEILKSFLIGIRLDIYVINYSLTIFFLVACFPLIKPLHFFKIEKIVVAIMTILFCFIYFVHLLNIEFFKIDYSHINYTAIEYAKSSNTALFMAVKKYHLFRYIFINLILMIFYIFLLKKFVLKKGLKTKNEKFHFNYNLIKNIFLYFIFSFLIFLGIRGGLSTGIMEWGTAFFSEYDIINQATLNPLFNFSKDVYYVKKNNDGKNYKYFKDIQEAINLVQNIALSDMEKDNIKNLEYPFFRLTKRIGEEKNYNIVILLMESMSAEMLGVFGNNLGLSPNFDKLAEKGILFTNFYSNGHRTNIGISSTLCSYIPLVGNSIMSRVEGQQYIPSIASILKEKGYSTIFIYGGDLKFDNMFGFLKQKGFEKVIGVNDFDDDKILNKWGASDEYLFERTIKEIDELASLDNPFFTMALSLTNHPPYTIPDTDFGERIKTNSEFNDSYNTFKYMDYSLGEFFNEIEKKDYFENTVFIILGDHGKSFHYDTEFDYRKSFVPCLIYAPKIFPKPSKNDKISSQIDIAPTIFDILNMTIESSFFGRSLFEKNFFEKDFAIIVSGNYLGFIKKGFFYFSKIGKTGKLHKLRDFSFTNYKDAYANLFEEMKKEVYAFSEVSFHIFKTKKIADKKS
ncbi:MAG: sulfatase-like hydrolase/transferase [Elusimicrobiota bacterium]|nr:sulfatase-like hydrolase/transferase [Elusimicrobiota bacterium]